MPIEDVFLIWARGNMVSDRIERRVVKIGEVYILFKYEKS